MAAEHVALPIVIDNGSDTVKAGFAGEDTPRAVFPSIIGRPCNSSSLPTEDLKSAYIGDEAYSKRGSLTLQYPIKHGVITNWDNMEKIWLHTLCNELRATPNEHPVLLSQPLASSKSDREKTTQIFFESFNVPAFYVHSQASLSVYGSGHQSGILLDSGHSYTYAVGVNSGFPLSYTFSRTDVSGHGLTDYLSKILAERGYNFPDAIKQEIVSDIKEKLCYVPLDFDQEMQISTKSSSLERSYELPDGRVIDIGNERFRATEALFEPSLIGSKSAAIHVAISNSIMKSDDDIRMRCYGEIILAGGNTLFPGLQARLEKEIAAIAPSSANVKVIAPLERKYLAWIGGSTVGRLSSFPLMWISKQEYDEVGPSVVHRKCFE